MTYQVDDSLPKRGRGRPRKAESMRASDTTRHVKLYAKNDEYVRLKASGTKASENTVVRELVAEAIRFRAQEGNVRHGLTRAGRDATEKVVNYDGGRSGKSF